MEEAALRPVWFLLLAPAVCLGAIGDLRVIGTTATQAIIGYTAPDQNPCTIQVSEDSSLTPLVHDVDPTIFKGADQDNRPGSITNGQARVVVIGKRSSELATAGDYAGVRHFSRALQADTAHYGKVVCGQETGTFTFSTTNIPLGNTYGDPWLRDPSHPGDQPWPESIGGLAAESFIDPLTGVLLKRIGLRGLSWGYWPKMAFGTAYNQSQMPCDSAGPWTDPCSVLADDGSSASVGNSTAWLVIRAPMTNGNAWNAGYGSADYGQIWTLDQLAVTFKGYASSSSDANRQLDVCLSLNGGASCASQIQTITLDSSAGGAPQTAGQADTTQFGILPWLLDTNPRLNVQETSPHSGTASVAVSRHKAGFRPLGTAPATAASGTGSVVTWTSGQRFSLYWTTGGNGRIRLSAKDDACITPPSATTSQEVVISGMIDGTRLVVSGATPAGSNLYWCENNFAVMIRRHQAPTDNSTVYLEYASMAAVESTSPTYPDNGAGTACFNQLVDGGYFCMFGGLYWINPGTGDTVYYGYMIVPSNGVGNPWGTIGIIPAAESAVIDQTQSNLTFYSVGVDPSGGGPLVVEGVFNPPSIVQPTTPFGNGSQIGNAAVTKTTAYSVSYSNGLTFTNMTPQVSAAESVVEQMASFDPAFNPAMFRSGPNGWNCGPSAMSAGVFYFYCESIGEDSPAWVFAFSPGDGDPAHAGAPGGPRIVGAVSTFDTPSGPVSATQTAAIGRSLHAVGETGETGWILLQMNPYPSINTSSISSIPATSQDCGSFGVSGGGECIEMDIDSATAGGVTGYEPYLPAANRQYQFKGAPGELRTAQLGDTACVAATSAANCSWYSGANELMTLVEKNADGHWIFRRKSYGAELAIASGPVTLWWISNQTSIPPGGTTANSSLAAYWNPLAGCAGAPDPHGDCMIQDSNNTSGHGEWRDGGEAVATNVPQWGQPIYGWPTDYQTAVGSVPGILRLPFADVTPNQAAGVNYTSTDPPFDGVFGVPWGFDGGTHPNAAGANAPPNEAVRAFDNIPVQGGGADPVFTWVTRQLYAATPDKVTSPDDIFGSGSVASIDRRVMATGASCGSHPLIDVSGPSSRIADDPSGSYTYCIARANGECVSDSTVGQIYVNCPGVVWTQCTGSAIHGGTPLGVGNDICVGNIGAAANMIRQFSLEDTDYAGAFTRNLVSATSRLRMVTGFENNRLLPDNSWLLFRAEWLNYSREEMWMAKMLPYPAPDSVNRGTFVPMALNLQPPAGAGVDNAVVEFGYGEYNGNCTTRNDPCMANSAMVGSPPFQFASENPGGAPCASGCTITIPAISQRVLYYQVMYRDRSNKVVATSPQQAAAVP